MDDLAVVSGENIQELPKDLYIPPKAMRVILEVFQGPLDLLLYLIKKHNLDILDIPVAAITKQYIEYIEMMEVLQVELAADYLEMAAILTEVKSRMLLPKPPTADEEEEDPRAELIRRLQEYEQIKTAAHNLDEIPRFGRDFVPTNVALCDFEIQKNHPDVDLTEVLLAFRDILKRVDMQASHHIERETLSVREKMAKILSMLSGDKFVDFSDFFDFSEGRQGVVVTFLAILEMTKERILFLEQREAYAPIYVRLQNDS